MSVVDVLTGDTMDIAATALEFGAMLETFCNNTPKVVNPLGGTLLLLISDEQKRMLARYGSTTCLDATYKINKWGYAFFMLAVVDEHRHAFPCAFFIIQHETVACVAEALAYLKHLVPQWNPITIITDKDDAEISACKINFPSAIVVLCEFHVKQAWLRWLRTGAHSVPKEQQMRIYTMLSDILKSSSAQSANHKVSICILSVSFINLYMDIT